MVIALGMFKTPEEKLAKADARRQAALAPFISEADETAGRGGRTLVMSLKPKSGLPAGDVIDAVEARGWTFAQLSATAAAAHDPKVMVTTPEHHLYLVFRRIE